MGTNYYAQLDICECCDRPEKELHIGKSSFGWTFSFRGYNEDDFDEQDYALVGENIHSYKDWLDVLSRKGVIIYNEYHDQITLDEFKEIVESKKDSQHNHVEYILSGKSSGFVSNEYKAHLWLDEEGHSFTHWEFS